jgi:hypothetical protein
MLVPEAGVALERPLGQIRQGQIIKQELEKLFLGKLENEIIHALTAVGCFPRAPTAAGAALRALDSVTLHEFLVARVHDAAAATGAVVKDRLRDVIGRYHDLFTPVHVGDAAAVHRIRHRLPDVLLVAFQESLPVYRAFVLGIQPPVNDV